jgi:hypothetical protein
VIEAKGAPSGAEGLDDFLCRGETEVVPFPIYATV